MSYSILAAIFLATIALSSATGPVFDRQRNVLVRFYPDFAQLYRLATMKSVVDPEQNIERYQFYFTEREFSRIAEESVTMLYTNVIERTVTFHPSPNFAINGSRYFYRRDRRENQTVEIELVNPEDRLFREVNQPNRYFYLPLHAYLEYASQVPVTPYYEVTFICNASVPQNQPPLLSYIDRSLRYAPRYLLDLPTMGGVKRMELRAYADIRYTGEVPLVIKSAELVAGDITLSRRPSDYVRTALADGSNQGDSSTFTRPLGEEASGTYIYQLFVPSSIAVPALSIKSVRFLETKVTVEPFLYYLSVFTPVNSTGKSLLAYNLTSLDTFLPAGHLFLREQGRFIGQSDIPDLAVNSTFTMIFGSDADVSYRRDVTVLSSDGNSNAMSYYVEYTFENAKPSQDVKVYFFESFNIFNNVQIESLSTPRNNRNLTNIALYGTDLRGYVFLPRRGVPTMISYTLNVPREKPTVNA